MSGGTNLPSGDRATRHIAVFGDTHGHLRLMLQLCRLWQLENGVHLDGVLQCGDLGFFPDPAVLDRATRRYARRDPEEMGFARFFAWPEPPEADPLVERILRGPRDSLDSLVCDVVFCHGNHEDFASLERQVGGEVLAPVDAFGVLKLLKPGHVVERAALRVAAIGGAPERGDGEPPRRSRHSDWSRVSERACAQLIGERFDILLSHAAPRGAGGENGSFGSRELRWVVDACQPAYHVFAHHSHPIAPTTIGRTRCLWFADVAFEPSGRGMHRYGPLKAGCMGLLRWRGPEEHDLQVVDDEWIGRVNAHSWHRM